MSERITAVDLVTRGCFVRFLGEFCQGEVWLRIWSGGDSVREIRFRGIGPRGLSAVPDNTVSRGLVSDRIMSTQKSEELSEKYHVREIVSEDYSLLHIISNCTKITSPH